MIQRDAHILGPLFLLFTLALGNCSLELVFAAAAGLYMAVRFRTQGCFYALALLVVGSIGRHLLFVEDHLFQLTVEGSLGAALLITACGFENKEQHTIAQTQDIATKTSHIKNLEEELAKHQETAQEARILIQERVVALQKELDELQSDHSSILILNEVLRKQTAKSVNELERVKDEAALASARAEQLSSELKEVSEELSRVKNSEQLVQENVALLKDLNQARFDKEQTHLINEAVARLYAKEAIKAKEVEKEAAELEQQLRARVQNDQELLTELKIAKSELAVLQMQNEELRQQKVEVAPIVVTNPEELNAAYEKIAVLSKLEPRYKQLQAQYDERNKVLHEARSELFKAETELQRLYMEAEEKAHLPASELTELCDHIEALEEENRHLQDLINSLSGVKKK